MYMHVHTYIGVSTIQMVNDDWMMVLCMRTKWFGQESGKRDKFCLYGFMKQHNSKYPLSLFFFCVCGNP